MLSRFSQLNKRTVQPLLALSLSSLFIMGSACSSPSTPSHSMSTKPDSSAFPETFTREELKSRLTREEFHVTQEKGTERPWSSKLNDVKGAGDFECVVCGHPLFDAKQKFDSGTGWPSFYDKKQGAIATHSDRSLFMTRTEVVCKRCGAHLGHVFDDGPRPTGLRYCINGASLKFKSK